MGPWTGSTRTVMKMCCKKSWDLLKGIEKNDPIGDTPIFSRTNMIMEGLMLFIIQMSFHSFQPSHGDCATDATEGAQDAAIDMVSKTPPGFLGYPLHQWLPSSKLT